MGEGEGTESQRSPKDTPLTADQQERYDEFKKLKGDLQVILRPSEFGKKMTPDEKANFERTLAQYTQITGITQEERLSAADSLARLQATYDKSNTKGSSVADNRQLHTERELLKTAVEEFTEKEREAGLAYAKTPKEELPPNVVDISEIRQAL